MHSTNPPYTVLPQVAKLIACMLTAAGAGCAAVEDPALAPGPAPTANVGKLEAWKDVEMLAKAGQGRVPAVGQGSSMAPIYGENTMLVIAPIAFEDLQAGMIVAYLNPRGFQVVHRLMEKTREGDWRVRGLNNEREDNARVNAVNLLGVVYASLVHEERVQRAPQTEAAPR